MFAVLHVMCLTGGKAPCCNRMPRYVQRHGCNAAPVASTASRPTNVALTRYFYHVEDALHCSLHESGGRGHARGIAQTPMAA